MGLSITATNITSGPAVDVYIEDMGRPKIVASGSRLLTNEYTEEEIKNSEDLRQAIVDDKIVLNLGSGDLSKADSLGILDGSSILSENITNGLFGANSPSTSNVFATIDDLGGSTITTDENEALENANSPSSSNPIATMDDIGGSTITTNENEAMENANSPSSSNPFATIDDITSNNNGGIYTISYHYDSTAKDRWLDCEGKDIESNQTSGLIPFDSELIAITFSNQYQGADTDVEVYVADFNDGSSPITKILNWSIRDKRTSRKSNFTSTINLNAMDKVAIFLRDKGTDVKEPIVILYFKITNFVQTEVGENHSGYFSVGGGGS